MKGGVMNEYISRCKGIIEWANDKQDDIDFDTMFVEDVMEKTEKYGSITDGQKGAIDKIWDKFHIERHFKKLGKEVPGSVPKQILCPHCGKSFVEGTVVGGDPMPVDTRLVEPAVFIAEGEDDIPF